MQSAREEERQDDEDVKRMRSAGCSCCTLLFAVIGIIIGCMGLYSEPVWVIDRLLHYDVGYDYENWFPLLTTAKCMQVLLIASIVLAVIMACSFLGSLCKSKLLMAIGTLFAFVISIWMLGSAFFMLSRYDMVTPTIDRQVGFLCNTTVYNRLSTNMNCTWASSSPKPECGTVCQERVKSLLTYQGCEFMPKLCTQNVNGVAESDISSRWWNHVLKLSIACIVLGTMLIVTTTASCCFTYIMNFNRRGKPTAENLCWLMLCPCCPGDAGKGFTTYDSDEDADDIE